MRDESGRINEGSLSVNGLYVAMFDFSFARNQAPEVEAIRLPARVASVAERDRGHRAVNFDILDSDLEPFVRTTCYMKDSYVSTSHSPRQGYLRGYTNSITEQNVQSFVASERRLNVAASVEELEQALLIQ
jgi:hypothetical protein